MEVTVLGLTHDERAETHQSRGGATRVKSLGFGTRTPFPKQLPASVRHQLLVSIAETGACTQVWATDFNGRRPFGDWPLLCKSLNTRICGVHLT